MEANGRCVLPATTWSNGAFPHQCFISLSAHVPQKCHYSVTKHRLADCSCMPHVFVHLCVCVCVCVCVSVCLCVSVSEHKCCPFKIKLKTMFTNAARFPELCRLFPGGIRVNIQIVFMHLTFDSLNW